MEDMKSRPFLEDLKSALLDARSACVELARSHARVLEDGGGDLARLAERAHELDGIAAVAVLQKLAARSQRAQAHGEELLKKTTAAMKKTGFC